MLWKWNTKKQYYESRKAKFAQYKKQENLCLTELDNLFGDSKFTPGVSKSFMKI
jgi:hypothetical protein